MAATNSNLVFRPLRGGIAIFNPRVNTLGTLGMIASSDGSDRWIISCYHVLCASGGGPAVDGDPIFQPIDDIPSEVPVARVSVARASLQLDAAAAKVEPGFMASPAIHGIRSLSTAIPAAVGMHVVKYGQDTGITEGVIDAIDAVTGEVTVVPSIVMPLDYELTTQGDSGAVWVEWKTGSPVALHCRGNAFGAETSHGPRIVDVLQALNLQPLP